MWAMQAAKMGYSWKVGDVKRVRFWEDIWFGNTSLAVQYWDLYIICNEHGKTVADVWDGQDLRLTFRRNVSERMYLKWIELVNIAGSVQFSEEPDRAIWHYNSIGLYNSQSLYAIVSFGGIQPVYPPVIWGLLIPHSGVPLANVT